MADVKISALPAASTPLTGAEVLPIVQSSVTTKVAVSNLTAGLSGTASININGTVGATTPTTGAFTSGTFSTTLGVTGTSTLGNFNPGNSQAWTSIATTGYIYADFVNTSGRFGLVVEGSTANTAIPGSLAYASAVGSLVNKEFYLLQNNAISLKIEVGGAVTIPGTLGVGTSSAKATLQVGTRVGVFQPTTDAAFGENLYYSSGWKYIATAAASVVYLDNGAISFLTAPSGSADATASVTSRMSISNAGIVTMAAYGAGAATFSAAGVISSVSDETWKIKDGTPTNPDAMLNKLAPGYWYYNNEKKETFGKDRQLGFYAQNVNAAIGPEAAPEPETVTTKNEDGTETITTKPWGYYDRSVLAITVMSLQKALTRLAALEAK